MTDLVVRLCFGATVRFADRWRGRVTGFDVDESWEILNVVVAAGLIKSTSVKLPLDKATLAADHVAFPEFTSHQAFAREVPPVAAPARLLSLDTTVSLPGMRLAGALVDIATRHAAELLLRSSGVTHRLPVGRATLEGKQLRVSATPDELERYFTENELADMARDTIARRRPTPLDELQAIDVTVRNGRARIGGNVRNRQAIDLIRDALGALPPGSIESIQVADDISLEFEIAQALYRTGVATGGEIFPRSGLGEVTLFGNAISPEVAAEAVRVASRVPGVRAVHDRIDVQRTQPVVA